MSEELTMKNESKSVEIVDLICEGPNGVIEIRCKVTPRGKRFVVQPAEHNVLSGQPPLVSMATLLSAYQLQREED